jgi:hypothetical protein
MPLTGARRLGTVRAEMGGRLLVVCCLALAALVPAAAHAGGGPAASAARTCSPPRYPGSGYFTSLTVKRVGCSTGRKLALAYYRCRIRHGGRAGRCRSKVMHYRCHETRNSIPTEIDARVTCRLHRRTVVHTYQQNL